MPSLETFFKLIDTLKIPLSEFGAEMEKTENTNRDKIIKEIYSSDNEELELYLNLIESVKKYNTYKKHKKMDKFYPFYNLLGFFRNSCFSYYCNFNSARILHFFFNLFFYFSSNFITF